MRAFGELGRRLLAVLKPTRMKDEIDEEMRFHIEMLAEEKRESGLNAEEAWHAALRQFGNAGVLKERSRDAWDWTFLEQLAQDLLHVYRAIVRTPMQTFLIFATLGLAMGSVLAVFSLFDKLVMKPLPAEKPSELVSIRAIEPEPRKSITDCSAVPGNRFGCAMDYPFFKFLRERATAFKGMSAYLPTVANLDESGTRVRVHGFLVTGNYFDLIGIKAKFGRTLSPEDDRTPESDAAVVLSHGFWQRRFGGDPSILHRKIFLDKHPMVVVGVLASGFSGTDSGFNADFFASLKHAGSTFWKLPGFRYEAPGYDMYRVLARLAPGMDIRQAERATESICQRLSAEFVPKASSKSTANRAYHAYLLPAGYASALPSDLLHDVKSPLMLLMALVALVLIVATGNVANLLLARRTARSRETAIRYALGSSRGRILRELLGESLLLSSGGAIFGYFLASWAVHLIPVLYAHWPSSVSAELDTRSHLFAIGLALITGIVIWGASAMRATKRSLLPALIENAAVGGAPRANHWRRIAVALQISFSLILLCVSFVLCRSLLNLMSVDPGFSADNLYSFSIDLRELGFKGDHEKMLLNQIVNQARAIPGVHLASMTDNLPMSGSASINHVCDRPIPMDDEGPRAIIVTVGTDYFKTMGIPLIAGHEFKQQDQAAASRIVAINEPLARILFGASNPIGRRVWVGGDSADVEIVGLVKETKGLSLRDRDTPYLYSPIWQKPLFGYMGFVLRSSGPAISLMAVRAALKIVEPSVQVAEFGSIEDRIPQSIYRDRTLTIFSLCFAGLASILCAMGVFGLTSCSISGRTKEIGLRIALGANSGSIHRLVMKEILLLSILGCSVGLAVFIAIKRLFASMLFQLTPTDPASLIVAILFLGMTAFFAGYIPSRRAAKLDPSLALRWE
jgi:predicted permease